ncbi:MAG: hypothetical protein AB1442_09365 [Nitrospirota bacterium]
MRKVFRLKIWSLSLLIAVGFVFFSPMTGAAQSNDYLLKGLTSVLRLDGDEKAVEEEKFGFDQQEKTYSKVISSTSHVNVSLSERLKIFFDLRRAIRDYYEEHKNERDYAVLGIDISF